MCPGCVVLFTKPARPGRVKTRLIGELSAAAAAQIHGVFLQDLVARLQRGPYELRVAWALERREDPPTDLVPGSVAAMRQTGKDLGERLFNALNEVGKLYPRVAALGSDHPDLDLGLLEEAFELLGSGSEVVLGPARDGGYYLVAVRARSLRRRLFEDVPWSTAGVLEETLARCRETGVATRLLEWGEDVDTADDLRRLARSPTLATRCPRTHELLASWGWVAAS